MYLNIRKGYFNYLYAILLLLPGCGGGGGGGEATPNPVATQPGNNTIHSGQFAVAGSLASLAGEGGYDTILTEELAVGNSSQTSDNVVYTIVIPPTAGELEIEGEPDRKISQFTQADIDADRVVYKHERGASLFDSFEFDVNDGQGNILVGEKFHISIVPNVTALGLDFDDGNVTLSWTPRPGGGITGVEVWRRDDGHYPAAPLDGVMVNKQPAAEQQITDSVSVDSGDDSQSIYYTVFSYGKNGVYSGGVNVGLYCDSGQCVTVPDLRDLNSISSQDDVGRLRSSLLSDIWGVDTLPGWMPASVNVVFDDRYSNAQSIEEILVNMDHGIFSRIWFFTPGAANGKLVIYHQGHRGAFHRGLDIIQRLLEEGFHVLGVSMPLIGGMNKLPDESFTSHEDFADLDRPMRFFLEPVSVALNYVTSVQGFSGIYMMGISGGGWTTVIYASIDERIAASYPVAGSWPFYLREQLGGDSIGDFEQTNPEFYNNVSYIELYLMGVAGRRQLQIFNEFDDCCYEGTYSGTYRMYIRNLSGVTGGSFDAIVDDTVAGHQISEHALDRIITDINLY